MSTFQSDPEPAWLVLLGKSYLMLPLIAEWRQSQLPGMLQRGSWGRTAGTLAE